MDNITFEPAFRYDRQAAFPGKLRITRSFNNAVRITGNAPDSFRVHGPGRFIYISFFHRLVPFVGNDAASLRVISAPVNRFYFVSLFF